ncbi:MAG: hypothetical protein ACYCPQ_07910 [Elusimicrobiota bacterium]
MKPRLRGVAAPAFFCAVFLSGACTYYTVSPAGVPVVSRQSAPIPLRVGIVWTPPQRWKAYPNPIAQGDEYENCLQSGISQVLCDKRSKTWDLDSHWDSGRHKFGELFTKTLTAANIFQSVIFPVPDSLKSRAPADIFITVDKPRQRFDSHDLGLELFIPLTMPLCDPFLVGCPFVNTTHDFIGNVGMTVSDASGRKIKEYAGKEDVSVVFPDFNAPPLPFSADKDASTTADDQLAVELVQELANDRSFYAKLAASSSAISHETAAPRQRPTPASNQNASPGWWKQ